MYTPPPRGFPNLLIVKDLLVVWRVTVHNKGHVRERMSAMEQAGDRQ